MSAKKNVGGGIGILHLVTMDHHVQDLKRQLKIHLIEPEENAI